jgi:hypothetical protein
MRSSHRVLIAAAAIACASALALAAVAVTSAAVRTDKPDYPPGATVTISGDNGNGAGYVPGNAVDVAVTGPSGWTSSCSATVDPEGAWSCQVILDPDPAVARGAYTYTATSVDADGEPISEPGTFTDGNSRISLTVTGVQQLGGQVVVSFAGQYEAESNCSIFGCGPYQGVPGVTITIYGPGPGDCYAPLLIASSRVTTVTGPDGGFSGTVPVIGRTSGTIGAGIYLMTTPHACADWVLPTNNAPVVTVTGIAAGQTYEVASVPSATCHVTDDHDTPAPFLATLSPVTGPDAAYGLGDRTASCSYADMGGLTGTASATYHIVDTAGLVNRAPQGTDTTIPVAVESSHAFAPADFGFTDPLDTPPDSLMAVKITTLPTAGSLTLAGSPVQAGDTIPVSELEAGSLRFQPGQGQTGMPYATFTFQVQDDGGTAYGGIDLDRTPATMTINVRVLTETLPETTPRYPAVGANVQLFAPIYPGYPEGFTGPGPTGTVSFVEGATELCDAAVVDTANSWAACDSVTFSTVGDHEFTASYSGDGTYAPSAGSYTVTVKHGVDIALTGVPNPSAVGEPVTFKATLTPSDPTSAMPTGILRFSLGRDPTSTDPGMNPADPTWWHEFPVDANGAASWTTSELPVGTTHVYATYLGDENFAPTWKRLETPLKAVSRAALAATEQVQGTDWVVELTQVVHWGFAGFFAPVDNSTLNVAKAGSAIPVKFSLGGDQGLDIFADGHPKAVRIACAKGEPTDVVEEYVATSTSGLKYDAASGRYQYNWKTTKGVTGCFQLKLSLKDGSVHTADFQLK